MRIAQTFTTLIVACALTFVCTAASADSFLTSVATKSRTAARTGGGPAYRGRSFTPKQAQRIAKAGLRIIKGTKNIAIAHDVLRRVDSATMSHPSVQRAFGRGLAKLAKTGDARLQLIHGANLVMQNAGSNKGVSAVRKAVDKLSGNSAAHLVAGLTIAQRDSFGSKFGQWEKVTALKREAAAHLNAADLIERKTSHPRKLVRTGVKEAKAYGALYDGLKRLLH